MFAALPIRSGKWWQNPDVSYADVVAVIPAYEPDEELPRLVDALREDMPLIVVNDGSRDALVFECLPADVTVLAHERNRGKGAALKTAFRYALGHYPDIVGVVTVDADGQHLPEDALKVAGRLRERSSAMVFGVRHFGKDVPLRNRLGNVLTRSVLDVFLNIRLSDTQNGIARHTAGAARGRLGHPVQPLRVRGGAASAGERSRNWLRRSRHPYALLGKRHQALALFADHGFHAHLLGAFSPCAGGATGISLASFKPPQPARCRPVYFHQLSVAEVGGDVLYARYARLAVLARRWWHASLRRCARRASRAGVGGFACRRGCSLSGVARAGARRHASDWRVPFPAPTSTHTMRSTQASMWYVLDCKLERNRQQGSG